MRTNGGSNGKVSCKTNSKLRLRACVAHTPSHRLTLNMKERSMWSLPSLSLSFLRSSASGESGSTRIIFTFHSYKESFTSST